MPAESQNAVIYARYSSHSQTEQSIEGQLHDAYAYAERCGYHVIGEYVDRALTGKSDDRPDFQRMIKDAEKKQFQVVIVWKLDRFARNRYDSAIYKQRLKKYGIRVVSVMESITDSPEGIILEGLLESMAEYYSANLSENIKRGQQASVAKGWFCASYPPYGYRVQDHRLVPDERTAPIVREIYRRYAAGEGLSLIAEDLNRRGCLTSRGRPFSCDSFSCIVPNTAYIGEYVYGGKVVPGCAVPIIDPDTYAKACARREQHKRAPSAGRHVHYLLQGKSFCGICGMPLCGDFGTGKNRERYFYYVCSGRKRRLNDCRKHPEKQDFLEWYVCEQTQKYILAPERLPQIASAVADLYNAEIDDSKVVELEKKISALEGEMNLLIGRLGSVSEKFVPRINQRMEQVDAEISETEIQLSKLRLQQSIRITPKEVAAWLRTFSRGDLFDADFRQKLIDTFVNSVYLWDDKIIIFYNLSGSKQVTALEPLDLEAIKKDGLPVSELPVYGGAYPADSETRPYFIFVRNLIGLVIFR